MLEGFELYGDERSLRIGDDLCEANVECLRV